MQTTYNGGRAESAYLADTLEAFFDDHVLSDILFKVKGGKEANVYCCQSPRHGLIAAKVYRPPEFRAMKNDWLYRLGRGETDASGKAARESRQQRAMAKRTSFGKQLRSGSWVYSEVAALEDCHAAGMCVPRLIGHGEHAILMEFLGTEDGAWPTLHGQHLSPGDAGDVWLDLREDLARMLSVNRVHGDLSPYNVLFDGQRPWIIDLPQTVHPLNHPAGYDLLLRDVSRLCDYFNRQGVSLIAEEETQRLWREEFG